MAENFWYKPGISFINARTPQMVTKVRRQPWFIGEWETGPHSVESKMSRWDTGKIYKQAPVWNRVPKQMMTNRLGLDYHEIPSFDELGDAAAPTGETRTTERNFWGALENIVSSTADVMIRREEQRAAQAAGEQTQLIQTLQRQVGIGAQFAKANWPVIIGVGALGVGLWYFMR